MTDVPGGPHAQPSSDINHEFGPFYAEFYPRIRNYLRLGFRRMDAAAATATAADVISKCWDHWATIRDLTDPGPYVMTIARNLATDAVRKKKREIPSEIDDRDVAMVTPFVDADVRLELAETLRAMRKLPQRQREALALTGSQFSPQEIAHIMGVNVTTIYKYLAEGRRELERKIGRAAPTSRGRPRPLPPENPIDLNSHPDREEL